MTFDPDGLQRLWAPHRMTYIAAGDATAHDDGPKAGRDGDAPCPFCAISRMPDPEGLVVARGAAVFAVLNLYPYNTAHLMVVPYRHVAGYPDATDAETGEMARFTQHAMGVIGGAYHPHGFNIGINQGASGGAGIAGHLHQHVVPRWNGDANFMPVIAATKVLPQLLSDTRDRLAAAW